MATGFNATAWRIWFRDFYICQLTLKLWNYQDFVTRKMLLLTDRLLLQLPILGMLILLDNSNQVGVIYNVINLIVITSVHVIIVLVWLTGLFLKYKNFHIKTIIPPWTDILPIFIIIPKCHIFPEVKPLFKFRNTGFRYVVIAYLLTLSKFTALSATTLSHSPNQHSKASQP